jgi:FixJ family two-component response regulator
MMRSKVGEVALERTAALRVGVVDDDPRVLTAFGNLLESAGYAASLHPSGEAFLASDESPQVVCVISDIGLTGMSGIDLLNLLKADRPRLPVILISGRVEASSLATLENQGARFTFMKPCDPSKILEAVYAAITSPKD